jgi:hypothetical protein
MKRRTAGLLALVLAGLFPLAGCAALGSDEDFPPPVPPTAATRFRATPPDGLPFDVYFSAWGEGYVIYTPGAAPAYLISDKRGGFLLQRVGESVSFVSPRSDGLGWNVLTPEGLTAYLLKQEGGAWLYQSPGGLPTLLVPQ